MTWSILEDMIGYRQMLCHFIQGTCVSVDFGTNPFRDKAMNEYTPRYPRRRTQRGTCTKCS
jgi:hypothetical protein